MEREKMCEHVRVVVPYLKQQITTKLQRYPIVGDVRGSHFMIGIENVANKQTKALFPAEAKVGYRIADECQKRGFIVRPVGHLNIISPPLIWNKAVIDEVTDILDQAVAATVNSLQKDSFLK